LGDLLPVGDAVGLLRISSSSSSSSSCVIRLTIRLLLICLSWVCQFNLALCNMSFIQFRFWSFIRSATYCSFDGGEISFLDMGS
jgi:hypothetical protein